MLFFENFFLPLLECAIPVGFFIYHYFRRKNTEKPVLPVFLWGSLGICLGLLLAGIRVVPTGMWGLETSFGSVCYETAKHEPGLTWIRPWRQIQHISSRPQEVHPTLQGEVMQVVAQDGLLLTVDADLGMVVNKKHAGRIYSAYGTIAGVVAQLMMPAAHAAIKNSGTQINGKDAWEKDRGQFTELIEGNFKKTVIAQIRALPEFSDFSEEELGQVFTFLPVMLGPTLPPELVTNEVARLRAADEALNTEKSLTEVAKAKQTRSQAEAEVVAKYLEALPHGVSLSDIAVYENAMTLKSLAADKSRQLGPVTIVVSNGAARSGITPITASTDEEQ